jgi:hypothetical protein
LTWQIRQKVRAKNTALDRNLSGSIVMPVGIALPVSGHLIMTIPILFPPFASPSAGLRLFSREALGPAERGGRRFDEI